MAFIQDLTGFPRYLFDYIRETPNCRLADLKRESFGSSYDGMDAIAQLEQIGAIVINEQIIMVDEDWKREIEEAEQKELDLIYETVFDDYDYTFFRFMYNRGSEVHDLYFPDVLVDKAPHIKVNETDYGKLVNNLHRLRTYLDKIDNHFFRLNETGKRYFLSLQKKRDHLEQTSNLEIQKLNAEILNLTNQLIDFNKMKAQRKWALIVAILSLTAVVFFEILKK